MTERERTPEDSRLETALRLMRLALPLLDQAGRGFAAARLQHAIDGAENEACVSGPDG